MKVIQKEFQKRSVLIALVMTTCLLAFSNIGLARDYISSPVMLQSRIDAATQKMVTITEKTPEDMLANSERFFVTPNAVIINKDGAKVEYSDLLVPCKALVYYELQNSQSSEVVKIEVKEVLSGADKGWTMGKPE